MPRTEDLTPEERAALEAAAAAHGFMTVEMELPPWIGFVAEEVEMLHRHRPEGATALPPFVGAWKDGSLAAAVFACQCDAGLGLNAALRLRAAFDPDELVVTFDTLSREYAADSEAYFPPGSFQRLREMGYESELQPITDVIMVWRLLRGGAIECARLPYRAPKDGVPFCWEAHRFWWRGMPGREQDAYTPTGGRIVEAIKQIAALPLIVDHPAALAAAEALGYPRERAVFHAARGVMRLLREDGYAVIDMFSELHPEWLDPGTPAIDDEDHDGQHLDGAAAPR